MNNHIEDYIFHLNSYGMDGLSGTLRTFYTGYPYLSPQPAPTTRTLIKLEDPVEIVMVPESFKASLPLRDAILFPECNNRCSAPLPDRMKAVLEEGTRRHMELEAEYSKVPLIEYKTVKG